MKNHTCSFAIAAALAVAVASVGAVQAQGIAVATSIEVPVTPVTERTVAQIMAGMQFGSEARLEAIAQSNVISLVTLSNLTKGEPGNVAEITTAIAANSVDLPGLRTAIAENAQIGAALAAKGWDAEDVVAVSVVSKSELVLVVDDRG